jgi:galactokinase
LEITGTLAQGSGLSSSAALEVALCKVIIAAAGAEEPDAVELARMCSRIERDWVGAQTGLLDQLASLTGQREHAIRIDFNSLELEPVPLRLDGHKLVTLDSGEVHTHASSGYNERREECARACELLGIETLREATSEAVTELPAPLGRRATHVIAENERVDQTVAALKAHDWPAVGALLDASHASLRDLYEVSTAAVEAAVAALKNSGALGARIVGGGFGGHVLGLLAPGAQPPDAAIAVEPGPGAHLIERAQAATGSGRSTGTREGAPISHSSGAKRARRR